MQMSTSYSRIQLNHTLFVAIAIHACVILALGFNWSQSTNNNNTLEVTLAQFKSQAPNPDADFFAQMDQLGSGSAEQVKKLSDTQVTNYSPDNEQAEVTQKLQQDLDNSSENNDSKQPFEKNISTFELVSTNNSDFYTIKRQLSQPKADVANESHNNSLASQIVALRSQINLRRQEIAKAPRQRVLSTMSTNSHQDAAYLENWRRRIVSVGNIHYPKAADKQKIYGRVRLLIAMRANGSIKSIEILESSGKKILDQGAVKIVRLAAPFEPFSQEMRKNTDILEIIRTIEFEKSTQIY
jgi:protein TonB